MNKPLFLALTAPATLVFADIAVKFGVPGALHALPCVLTTGAQLSAAPAALVITALFVKRHSEKPRLDLSPS